MLAAGREGVAPPLLGSYKHADTAPLLIVFECLVACLCRAKLHTTRCKFAGTNAYMLMVNKLYVAAHLPAALGKFTAVLLPTPPTHWCNVAGVKVKLLKGRGSLQSRHSKHVGHVICANQLGTAGRGPQHAVAIQPVMCLV